MKKTLLLFFMCQALVPGFLSAQISGQDNRLRDFGTFTLHISGNIQVIPVDEGLLYLLIHEQDTLTVCHSTKIYSQAEIYLFPTWEDAVPRIDRSSWRYKELKDVRKIRVRKRKKSFAIIDLGPKESSLPSIPLELVYYSETGNKLFISAVCKTCDEGYRLISKSFSRKIIRALNTVEFKNDR